MVLVFLAVMLVESVEKRRVDEGAWPNHAGRPHHEFPEESTQGETECCCADCAENGKGVGNIVVVEHPANSCDFVDVDSVGSDVCHDGDADVLFDRERSRVQRPFVSKEVELGLW